ncbi:hypothetical protein DV451_002164 [Geotrichum candidum]|uniref:Protein-tyrosine-phosphatase n=1 Tax=Geotrichum candidum TaxID=1173061 RepID=A0A9P5G7E1_GEOCN|nr:hypothetical protein DV451_002164 [Geotrichum candidum]
MNNTTVKQQQLPQFLEETSRNQKFHNLHDIETQRIQSLFQDPSNSDPSSKGQWSIKDALDPKNSNRNRYTNILPFDHNRVRITTAKSRAGNSGEEPNDYINASLISLDLGKDQSIGAKEYIATQGPTRRTIGHFWQMLYSVTENVYCADSAVILMLTPVFERGREACAPYWPRKVGEELEVPNDDSFDKLLQVTCVSVEQVVPKLGDHSQYPHVKTVLKLKSPEDNIEKTIYHIHVDTWVDFDRPTADGEIFSLVRLVESLQRKAAPSKTAVASKEMPLVVHCSAGVGRTGTYLALDYMLTRSKLLLPGDKKHGTTQQINHQNQINSRDVTTDPIYELVLSMREQRMEMVQRISQYRYIYENVKEEYLSGGSSR